MLAEALNPSYARVGALADKVDSVAPISKRSINAWQPVSVWFILSRQ